MPSVAVTSLYHICRPKNYVVDWGTEASISAYANSKRKLTTLTQKIGQLPDESLLGRLLQTNGLRRSQSPALLSFLRSEAADSIP